MFAALATGLNLYVFPGSMIGWNPSPLWIMVLIIAMRHGSPAGLVGGCLAAALHLWELTRGGHAFEELIHREPEMLIVPVLYIFIGMYLGETRERLARRGDFFKDTVDELNRKLDANEIKRLNLERSRLDMEKRIAGQADTLLGVYHNLNRLDEARSEDELWQTLADIVCSGMRAEAAGVWRLSPPALLAVVGALPETPPALTALAARRRGVATVGDWVSGGHEGEAAADIAGVLSDASGAAVALAVLGMEFGQLNRNSAIYFELVLRRAQVVISDLGRLESLRRISISDPDLGLTSENYLKTRIHEQALLARRHKTSLCLLSCANAGPADAALSERLLIVLACAIRSAIRASDGVAWFAGPGAFVIMLPQCDQAGAAVVIRNVAANLDMLRLNDDAGNPLFTLRWRSAMPGDAMDDDAMYASLFTAPAPEEPVAVPAEELPP